MIVPHGETGRRIVHHLLHDDEPPWDLLRRAQRYGVSVYQHQLDLLRANPTVAPCFPDREGKAMFWALTNPGHTTSGSGCDSTWWGGTSRP